MKRLLILLIPLLLCGCAARVNTLRDRVESGLDRGTWIESAPAVRQAPRECGAAALASVLSHWNDSTGADGITRMIGRPTRRGFLDFELENVARRRGFWCEQFAANFDRLKQFVDKDFPPIVIVSVGPAILGTNHYMVIRGYNEDAGLLFVNSGRDRPSLISEDRFQRRWDRCGRWTILVCPPEKVDWPLDAVQAIELGLLLEGKGLTSGAHARYLEATRKDPASAVAFYNLGNLFLGKGDLERAAQLYRKAIRLNPELTEAHNNLAWTNLETGHPERALAVISRGFKMGAGKTPEILDTFGTAYAKLGRTDEAAEAYRKALELCGEEKEEVSAEIEKNLKRLEEIHR